MKRKAWLVRAVTAVALSFAAASAYAQDATPRGLRKRASLLAQHGPALYERVCGAASTIGLCAFDARLSAPLLFGAQFRAKSSPDFLQKIQKLAGAFMDDVHVATVGDWKVKLRVEFK